MLLLLIQKQFFLPVLRLVDQVVQYLRILHVLVGAGEGHSTRVFADTLISQPKNIQNDHFHFVCGLISRDLFVPQVGSTILQCSSPSKAVRYTGGWLGCFGWVFLKTHFQRLMCRASSAVFRVETCQKQHHSRRYHIKAIVSC